MRNDGVAPFDETFVRCEQLLRLEIDVSPDGPTGSVVPGFSIDCTEESRDEDGRTGTVTEDVRLTLGVTVDERPGGGRNLARCQAEVRVIAQGPSSEGDGGESRNRVLLSALCTAYEFARGQIRGAVSLSPMSGLILPSPNPEVLLSMALRKRGGEE